MKPQESRKKSKHVLLLAALTTMAQGCSYQLTNLRSSSPSNIRTVYVEAVYDTSAEAIPHELLWDEIQRSIAANGQLKLAPSYEADAIVRAHISKTQTTKAGERKVPTQNKRKAEPDVFTGQQSPPTPGQLQDISIARDYYMKTGWSSMVQIEVWDLTTRKLLLQRQYPLSGEMPTIRGDLPAEIHHLRNEESFQHSFSNAARSVAERIVSDLLIH